MANFDKTLLREFNETDLRQYIEANYPIENQKRYGTRLVCSCPNPEHEDKSPSFGVNEKNQFHCFGCNLSGFGVIDFVKQVDKKSFPDTVKQVAKNLNIELRYENFKHQEDNNKIIKEIRQFNDTLGYVEQTLSSDPIGKLCPKGLRFLSVETEAYLASLSNERKSLLSKAGILLPESKKSYPWVKKYYLLPMTQNGKIISYSVINKTEFERSPLLSKDKVIKNPVIGKRQFLLPSINENKEQPIFLCPTLIHAEILKDKGYVAMKALTEQTGGLSESQLCASLRASNGLYIVVDGKVFEKPSKKLINNLSHVFKSKSAISGSDKINLIYIDDLFQPSFSDVNDLFKSYKSEKLTDFIDRTAEKQIKDNLVNNYIDDPKKSSENNVIVDSNKPYQVRQYGHELGAVLLMDNDFSKKYRNDVKDLLKTDYFVTRPSVKSMVEEVVEAAELRNIVIEKYQDNLKDNHVYKNMLSTKQEGILNRFNYIKGKIRDYEFYNANDEYAYKVQNRLANYYHQNLVSDSKANEYLEKRGITPRMKETFNLGVANQNTISSQLNADTFRKIVSELGLIKSDDGRVYDHFRNRIIFPIRNESGDVSGFAGRLYLDDNRSLAPKYLNSSKSHLYDKSATLYGLYESLRSGSNDLNESINVTEGYFDVISMHDYGLRNTVAPAGTALTEKHVEKLYEYTPRIHCIFDGDKAGTRASFKALYTSAPYLNEQQNISFAILPEGMDPDSVIQKEFEYAREFFNVNASPGQHLTRLFNNTIGGVETFLNRAKATDEVMPYFQRMNKNDYTMSIVGEFSENTGISKQLIEKKMANNLNLKNKEAYEF